MEKSEKQVNALFKRKLTKYQRQYSKEIASFASIPTGYGSRAYHRFKVSSDKSGETRVEIEDMVHKHKIDVSLLRDTLLDRILSAEFINEHQHTNFQRH